MSRKKNTNVHSDPLSRHERHEISKLCIIPRSADGSCKLAKRSVAWDHFGPLYITHAAETGANAFPQLAGQPVLLDDSRNYCR
jgi:hypothetical protein